MIISGGSNVYPKEVENHIDEIHEVRGQLLLEFHTQILAKA